MTERKCYRLKRTRTPPLVSFEQIQESQQDMPDSRAPSVERELLAVERRRLVWQAVQTLAERCRKLIHYLYYEEQPLSHRQLAELLSVSPASVGVLQDRCLKKLKTILTRRGFK